VIISVLPAIKVNISPFLTKTESHGFCLFPQNKTLSPLLEYSLYHPLSWRLEPVFKLLRRASSKVAAMGGSCA
jgi:hypothetical protein